MLARLASLLVWSLVAASVVAWGLRLAARGEPVPPHAATAQQAGLAALGDVSRLFGTAQRAEAVAAVAAPPADARFKLLGVVAPRAGAMDGLALITVDGKPARAVRLGAEVEPGLRLLSVDHRHAALGPQAGTVTLTLELPALAEANRGRPGDTAAVVAAPLPAAAAVTAGQAMAAANGGVPGGAPGGGAAVSPLGASPGGLPGGAGVASPNAAGARSGGRALAVPAGLAPTTATAGSGGDPAAVPEAGAVPNAPAPQNFH